MTLGGRRVPVRRPRVRAADGTGELPVPPMSCSPRRSCSGAMAMERMLAKLSTRRYRAGLEPVGAAVEANGASTSKSAVSPPVRGRDRDGAGRAAGRRPVRAGPGGVDGRRRALRRAPAASWPSASGSTAPSTPSAWSKAPRRTPPLVTDLIVGPPRPGPGHRPDRSWRCSTASKALRRAVRDVFDHPVIQRCQLHKIRNVERQAAQRPGGHGGEEDAGRLPRPRPARRRSRPRSPRPPARQVPSRRGGVAARRARRDLHRHPPRRAAHPGPDAAVDQRHRVDDRDLPRPRRQREALADGHMALRWCAAGMVEAAKQFRRVNGFLHLPALRKPSTLTSPRPSHPSCDNDEVAPPEHHRAATQVPRNSGHPPAPRLQAYWGWADRRHVDAARR